MDKDLNLQVMGSEEAKASAIIKTLSFIKAEWGLSYEKISELSHIPKSTIERWIKEKKIPSTAKTEIDLLINFIAIYKSLSQMFSSKSNLNSWLVSPHPRLNNQRPIEMMKSNIEGLIIVRRYLDYTRGRGA
jgi:putative toxin-antitoxin system antitoxin component (TIGR02293 family)